MNLLNSWQTFTEQTEICISWASDRAKNKRTGYRNRLNPDYCLIYLPAVLTLIYFMVRVIFASNCFRQSGCNIAACATEKIKVKVHGQQNIGQSEGHDQTLDQWEVRIHVSLICLQCVSSHRPVVRGKRSAPCSCAPSCPCADFKPKQTHTQSSVTSPLETTGH